MHKINVGGGEMREKKPMITFGPIPSRRLGRSLGINNIIPQTCSYSCNYCQLGRTKKMSVKRQEFYTTDELKKAVGTKIRDVKRKGERIDYLSFVPNGEPTLDINLGIEIEELHGLGIKIAVITNSSLLWQEEVRNDLLKADWVSLKIDTVSPQLWKKIDRPHGFLRLKWILEGIKEFSRIFHGDLVTESMLIEGMNDNENEITAIANFISELEVARSYIAIPIRPPAEEWVKPTGMKTMAMAYELFKERGLMTEELIGLEGTNFSCTGDVKEDLLAITAVHPMREDAVRELLFKAGEDWDIVEELIMEGVMKKVGYAEKNYYLRSRKTEES